MVNTYYSALEMLGQSADIKSTFDSMFLGQDKKEVIKNIKAFLRANFDVSMAIVSSTERYFYLRPRYSRWKLTHKQAGRLYDFFFKPVKIEKTYAYE